MKVSFLKSLLAAATIAAAGVANASPLGYTDWSEDLGENASWGLWDAFPAGAPWGSAGSVQVGPISNVAVDSGTAGVSLSATYGPLNPPAGAVPPPLIQADGQGVSNGVFYTGGVTTSFSLLGEATSDISLVYLQIKQDLSSAPGGGDLAGYFTNITLNGVIPLDAVAGDTFADGSKNFSITTWTFAVNISAGEQFALNFSGGVGGHRAFDGIRIDADGGIQAVPEPSTYAMFGLGLAVALWAARRRSIRA